MRHNEIKPGMHFAHLTVQEVFRDESAIPPRWMVRCLCDCGNTKYVLPSDWGKAKSCGCNPPNDGSQLLRWSAAHNTTGVTGVEYIKQKNAYHAKIKHKNIVYYLGYFKSIESAAEVRRMAEEHRDAGDLPEWYASYAETHLNKMVEPHRAIPRKRRALNRKSMWYLLDPSGNIVEVGDMKKWCADHEDEFSISASSIYRRFANMSRSLKDGTPQKPLHGWTIYKPAEYVKKAED